MKSKGDLYINDNDRIVLNTRYIGNSRERSINTEWDKIGKPVESKILVLFWLCNE